MSKLNLDAFKAKVNESETEELEALTGGILGCCHLQALGHPGNLDPIRAVRDLLDG